MTKKFSNIIIFRVFLGVIFNYTLLFEQMKNVTIEIESPNRKDGFEIIKVTFDEFFDLKLLLQNLEILS